MTKTEATGAKVPQSQPLTTAAIIERAQRTRFNPLRILTPVYLSQALDSFRAGHLAPAAMLWEAMLDRDDTLSAVENKRRLDAAQRTWEIVKIPGAPEPEASRHAAALEFFYNHVTASNAYDRNERGEMDKLLEQMMSAVAMKYAVHHIVWKLCGTIDVPNAAPVAAYTAEMEFVPLYFFENTTGRLRYEPTGVGLAGTDLEPEGAWMTTSGRGLMFAMSVAYQYKDLSLKDWVTFNERYAGGKVIGRTPGSADSPEGQAMASTVAAFTNDMAAVIYNDQGGDKSPIDVIEPKGSASVEAFAKMVERQDRKFASAMRGSDLGTMSAGDGKGTGASLQGEETDVLAKADACMLGGALRHGVDRHVIAFAFGAGTMPLAYVRIDGEEEEEETADSDTRANAEFITKVGGLVSLPAVAARLNVPLTEDESDAMQKPAESPLGLPIPPYSTANAGNSGQLIARTIAAMGGAALESVKPTAERIAALISKVASGEVTANAFAAEAEAIAASLPEMLTPELVAEIAAPLEGAFGNEVLNEAAKFLRDKAKLKAGTANSTRLGTVASCANAEALARDIPQDGWVLIAPYGDHPSPDASYVQHFTRTHAEQMAATWNSIAARAVRWLHNVRNGAGWLNTDAPIWEGHPDVDSTLWPTKRLLGGIGTVRAGATGLEGKATFNAEGMSQRGAGPLKPSPYWLHEDPDQTGRVYPELLLSVGLVPAPNIPTAPAWTRNSTEPDNTTMNQQELATLLGLKPEATWADIKTALQGATANAALTATANAAKETATAQLGTMQTQLATANADLSTANAQKALLTATNGQLATANAQLKETNTAVVSALLTISEKHGVISAAEKPVWEGKFTANASTAAAELATKQPTVNTRHLGTLTTPAALGTANARIEAFAGIVAKRQADHKEDYDTAYSRAMSDPANAALVAAMQDPTRK